jgi:hypothetical protein
MGVDVQKRDAGVARTAEQQPVSHVLKFVKQNKLHIRPVDRAREPSGTTAANRVYELAWDIGRDMHHDYGWKAYAARRLGLKYGTALQIINGRRERLGTRVVDQIASATGCPVRIFYDEEI